MSAFLTGFQDYLKNQKCVSSNTLQSYVRDIEHIGLQRIFSSGEHR